MRRQLLQIGSWLRRLAAWLAEANLLWFAFGLILLAVLIPLSVEERERAFRIAGLALQLLGIGTVAWGIRQTRRLFDHPTLWSRAADWLKRFPPYKRSIVIGAGAASAGAASVRGRAHVSSNPPPNATIEQRVASLERNIGFLDSRITGVLKELDVTSEAQAAALRQERQERTDGANLLGQRLEGLGTGGLHISAIGALWLFVGVILSTAAPELAQWLK